MIEKNWPRISVVVCVYNGAPTIELCMRELAKVDYPNFEGLIVDDGSTDNTKALVKENLALHPEFRLIELPKNEGLSVARNIGMQEANGEIVAYLDSDAYPSREWLQHLADLFMNSKYIAIGGPNLNPPNSNLVADCVDQSPGSPVCVLTGDTDCDHIAGCNLAIRRPFLMAIGGFDPVYRAAGDDVDICWRIQKFGGTLGYSEKAIVWHCRRDNVSGYLKQQRGYGRAEALLWRHWPEKFNRLGHITWSSKAPSQFVYATKSVYGAGMPLWQMLPQLPEWNLVLAGLGGLTLVFLILGALAWSPLIVAGFVLLLAFVVAIIPLPIYALVQTAKAEFPGNSKRQWKCQLLTFYFHLAQPLVRLRGRLEYGLAPWTTFSREPVGQ